METWRIGAAAALLSLAFTGCADDDDGPLLLSEHCTAIGWIEGLVVDLSLTRAWPAGYYEVALDVDGTPFSHEMIIREGVLFCSRPGCDNVEIGHDDHLHGYYLDYRIEAPTLIRIIIRRVDETGQHGGPTDLGLILRYEGKEVTRTTFTPSYTREEINGKGCGFATRATERLALTLP